MDKYSKNFLDMASKLDAITMSCGDLTELAKKITADKEDKAIKRIYEKLIEIASRYSDNKEIKQEIKALKESLIDFCGHEYIKNICNGHVRNENGCEKSMDELMLELNTLVGLKNVKQRVVDLMTFQKIQILRRDKGLHNTKSTLHMAFTGNPGTGKTTVARIVGHMYKCMGILTKGHFIEVSRTDLIAGYQGQTALKVKKVIEEAKGGVLFIDEAYSITENDHSDSYGRECLTELTKALEDYRDDLVVIVAGYTEPMQKFFDSNPGLKSRFNTFIEFEDYSPKALVEILNLICTTNDYKLDDDMEKDLEKYFEEESKQQDEHFANARLARNLYDDLTMAHAKRVISINNPSIQELSMITLQDYMVVMEYNKHKS